MKQKSYAQLGVAFIFFVMSSGYAMEKNKKTNNIYPYIALSSSVDLAIKAVTQLDPHKEEKERSPLDTMARGFCNWKGGDDFSRQKLRMPDSSKQTDPAYLKTCQIEAERSKKVYAEIAQFSGDPLAAQSIDPNILRAAEDRSVKVSTFVAQQFPKHRHISNETALTDCLNLVSNNYSIMPLWTVKSALIVAEQKEKNLLTMVTKIPQAPTPSIHNPDIKNSIALIEKASHYLDDQQEDENELVRNKDQLSAFLKQALEQLQTQSTCQPITLMQQALAQFLLLEKTLQLLNPKTPIQYIENRPTAPEQKPQEMDEAKK